MAFNVLITPADVREVINTSLTDDEINGLIPAAVALVNVALKDCAIDDGTMFEIQRWLTAHFIAIKASISSADSTSAAVLEEKLGNASIKYVDSSKTSYTTTSSMPNIKSTMWGQTAISFDPTGRLASLGGKPPTIVALTEN